MTSPRDRIVVKCGTRLLAAEAGLNEAFIASIARQIAALLRDGAQVTYVTSGAIAAGRSVLALSDDTLVTRQVLAAVGQAPLMATYTRAFGAHGVIIAQALLSRADLERRRGYLNARNTLIGLLDEGVLPIANENDVVATDELHFGDNDALSVLIAKLIGADRLILLTSTEGLHSEDPATDPDARLIREASEAPPAELERAAGGAGLAGVGGMRSKLVAARDAAAAGMDVVIARGDSPDVLRRLMSGESIGTHFAPTGPLRSSRDSWLSSSLAQRGTVEVDEGARTAIADQGRSLLPAGIRRVHGAFERGDLVGLVGPDGRVFARGLVNYDADPLRRISGQQSRQILQTLGYDNGAEAVHRDNLVLLAPAGAASA